MTQFQPVRRRSGVMAMLMHRKRSAQTPVSLVRSLSGLTLRFPVRPAHVSQASGPRAATNTRGLTMRRSACCVVTTRSCRTGHRARASVVLLQIQTGIEALDLFGVAVEHQSLALEELADSTLARLAPAGMVHVRVHVRIEPVLLRRRQLPAVHRLSFGEPDLHDRLGALEAVLP